jgi:hypothetical protein
MIGTLESIARKSGETPRKTRHRARGQARNRLQDSRGSAWWAEVGIQVPNLGTLSNPPKTAQGASCPAPRVWRFLQFGVSLGLPPSPG